MTRKFNSVVLLSGGIDSLLCAERARKTGELVGCVFVDYGHPAQAMEGWKAFAYCGERGIPLKVVHAFGLELGDMGEGEGARVVPCRNAILLSMAANVARKMGGNQLIIGANSSDQAEYVDCRPAFITGMAHALGISIAAPLLGWTKETIIQSARVLGLTADDAWSCYGAGPTRCGECPSCLSADEAWAR